MITNRIIITAATFISLGLMGTSLSFFGTSLPALQRFLNLNLEMAGMLTVVFQAGYAFTSFSGGLLSDFIRRDKILMNGCLMAGVGAILLGSWKSFPANFLLVLIMGSGTGFILSSSNVLLVILYPGRKGTILNIHHVFFGLGSLIGPLMMVYLWTHHNPWQIGYDGLGLLLLLLFVFFSFTKTSANEINSRGRLKHHLRKLFVNRYFILLVMINGLAIGTQFALMFLSVTFMTEAKGLSISSASIALSAFFVCLVSGRLVCSWLAIRIMNTKIILYLLIFQLAMVFLIWKADGWLSAMAVVASGLGCSGLFPCLLALTGTLFSEVVGTALGVLATAGGLGGMIICWLTGILFQRVSVPFGYIVLVLASFSALALFLFNYRKLIGEERQPSGL